MSCANCAAKVKSELLKLPDVLSADVDLTTGKAVIEMQKHINAAVLQKAVGNAGKYGIIEALAAAPHQPMPDTISWFQTYKPVILIFAYITLIGTLKQLIQGQFSINDWMRHFMAGFFLAFSFFKLLDLKGFAASYSNYDIIAKRIYAYGYIYPFIELALGILFLIPSLEFWANTGTLMVMSVSIVGVIQSVLNKRQIQCACLGSAFNLPVGAVTVFEDAIMIAMSAVGLFMRLHS